VYSSPSLLDVVDQRDGRGLDRLFQRLARELTAAETGAVRVATDPPADGARLAAHLLTAPTLGVELARRGVTVEIGVLAEAELWSVYQPIVSLEDRSVVAHEALLRGLVDGREVGGGDLFFVAENAGWLDRLDRIGDYPVDRLRELLDHLPQRGGDETISFALGEPQHPSPPLVQQAINDNAHLWGRYPPVWGTPAFRRHVGMRSVARCVKTLARKALGPFLR